MKVLLLGGTGEARRLSDELAGRPHVAVTVSLAGTTGTPAPYGGALRTGGFGGVDGLARYLHDHAVDVLVDATHAFAATMPWHAAAAAERCGVPRLRLVRPPWQPTAGDRWVQVAGTAAAARAVRRCARGNVLLTVGRGDLDAFRGLDDVPLVVRSIEPPGPLPREAEVVQARGPFTVADELALFRDRAVGLLVTKNSGGPDAKLVAARTLGIPVVMIRRPQPVPGPHAATVADALVWLDGVGNRGR